MGISDPSGRILRYVNSLFERLESVGYGEFTSKTTKKAVTLIKYHLYPTRMKQIIAENMEYQEGLNSNFQDYKAKCHQETRQKTKPVENTLKTHC